jgi:uncharacterized membrane protein
MLYAALKTLHVLAVVLWVGGMAFAHFFLRPALLVLEPPQRLKLMHAVLRRFFAAVLVLSALVLASGLWMIGRTARQVVQGGGSFVWPADWLLMTVVGVLMVAIFGHIRFVLYKRLHASVVAQQWPAAGAALGAIRQWVAVNLALGLALIVVVLML